jgi:hypothetical protein
MGLVLRVVYVGFVVNKVALGQVFLFLSFFVFIYQCYSIDMPYIHSCITCKQENGPISGSSSMQTWSLDFSTLTTYVEQSAFHEKFLCGGGEAALLQFGGKFTGGWTKGLLLVVNSETSSS